MSRSRCRCSLPLCLLFLNCNVLHSFVFLFSSEFRSASNNAPATGFQLSCISIHPYFFDLLDKKKKKKKNKTPRRRDGRRCAFRLRHHSDSAFSKQVLLFSLSFFKLHLLLLTIITCRALLEIHIEEFILCNVQSIFSIF